MTKSLIHAAVAIGIGVVSSSALAGWSFSSSISCTVTVNGQSTTASSGVLPVGPFPVSTDCQAVQQMFFDIQSQISGTLPPEVTCTYAITPCAGFDDPGANTTLNTQGSALFSRNSQYADEDWLLDQRDRLNELFDGMPVPDGYLDQALAPPVEVAELGKLEEDFGPDVIAISPTTPAVDETSDPCDGVLDAIQDHDDRLATDTNEAVRGMIGDEFGANEGTLWDAAAQAVGLGDTKKAYDEAKSKKVRQESYKAYDKCSADCSLHDGLIAQSDCLNKCEAQWFTDLDAIFPDAAGRVEKGGKILEETSAQAMENFQTAATSAANCLPL